MHMRSLLVACVLVGAACDEKKEQPAPPPAPPTGLAPACSADAWAKDVAELAKRAEGGASVIAPDGCSLFDGVMFARGFPSTAEEIAKSLKTDAECKASLSTGGSEYSFARVNGVAMVTRVRNASDDTAPQEQLGLDLNSPLVRAARCPRAEHRLDDEKDARVAMTYAIAATSLQKQMLARAGKGEPVDSETRTSMDQLCKAVPAPPARKTDKGELDTSASPEPFAAMSQLMAASFTVFSQTAKTVKVDSPTLEALRPAAREVLAHPPHTNLQGVCGVWSLVHALDEKPAGKPAGKTAKKPKKK